MNTCFEVKLWPSSKHVRHITVDEVLEIWMGSISYSGTGKYTGTDDRMVLWDQTPGTLPELDADAPIPAPAEDWSPCWEEPADEAQMIATPPGRGWWPVCWVQWKGEAADNWYNGSESEYRSLQERGLVKIWVVCWYQLFDGNLYLTLWPTYLLRSRI